MSSAKYSTPSRLRLNTSATDVVKQEFLLGMKSSLYRPEVISAILKPLNDIANAEVAASTRTHRPSHLSSYSLVSAKVSETETTMETAVVIRGAAHIVVFVQALKTYYDDENCEVSVLLKLDHSWASFVLSSIP